MWGHFRSHDYSVSCKLQLVAAQMCVCVFACACRDKKISEFEATLKIWWITNEWLYSHAEVYWLSCPNQCGTEQLSLWSQLITTTLFSASCMWKFIKNNHYIIIQSRLREQNFVTFNLFHAGIMIGLEPYIVIINHWFRAAHIICNSLGNNMFMHYCCPLVNLQLHCCWRLQSFT